ncbi:MAG: toxin-antitoxin system HicB family antitoxin [Acidimicrobiales bacterium]
MLLSPIVEGLSEDLKRSAALGGDEIRQAAEMLVDALGPAVRLRILDVLQQAGEELTASFPGAQVEMRLQGRDPVLTMNIGRGPIAGSQDDIGSGEAETARLTLRLPEGLKSQVERAANSAGVSINTWLVDAASQALRLPPSSRRGPKRMTGFVRG